MSGLLALLLLAAAPPAAAQAPNASAYQGRLQESGLPVNGVRQVEVRLCTAVTGGTCHPTPGSAPQNVYVANGVFKTTFTIPSAVNLAAGRWFLETAVGPFGGALNTLTPREELTSMPYAVYASSATTLLGTILPTQIVPGTLDSAVIARAYQAGSILTAALADGSVTTLKLAALSIDSSKLGAASVDSTKLAVAAVDTPKLAADSVTTAKILRFAVDTGKLATDSVDSAKLINNAVVASKIAALAVETAKLGPDAVTTPSLSDAAVTTLKIAALAVDASRIAANAVTNTKIAATSIDTAKIQPDAVITSALLNLSVTGAKLALNAVQTSKMGPDSVTTVAILTGSVSTSKIALSAIDTDRLNAAAVTGPKLALGALTIGGKGIDRLGAMTRMNSVTSFGTINLNIGARRHFEVFIHIPPLLSSTDVRIQFNSIGVGNYAVTRSTGGAPYSHLSTAGIDLLGGGNTFPPGTQLHVRLTADGNSGTPTFVTGTYMATAHLGPGFAPVQMTGSYGVTMSGALITDVTVLGLNANLPSGTYVAAYGEEFP